MTSHFVNYPAFGDLDVLSPTKQRKVQIKNWPLYDSCISPTPITIPSSFSSLATDVLCMIRSFIPEAEAIGLWRLGHKSLQQKLAAIRTVRLVTRLATSFNWPAVALSCYRNAKDKTISCPEYYEHMPLDGFSSADIPKRVRRLKLAFGNAALLFNQVKVLRASYAWYGLHKKECF